MNIKDLVSGLLGKVTTSLTIATVPKWAWLVGAMIALVVIYKIVT